VWASYVRLCSWSDADVPSHWVPLSVALHVLGQSHGAQAEQTDKPPVVHIPRVSSHHPFAPLPEALREQGLALVQRHLAGTHPGAVAELTAFGARVRQPLPATLPWVSVLIPTRNNPALLNQCLASLFAKTHYPNFDVVVVDNGSDTPEALACLAEWNRHERVRVLRDNSVFNYAALNNHAASVAQGDWVALLNDDIEVIDADWLNEMVSQAVRPDVGVVGARLLYPNGTLQHGGVFLVGTLSWHAHRHLDQAEPGYAGRAQLVQNLSCLTAACIVVKKDIYQQVGGLDATHFTVGWNDTDFCLKVQKAGYRNLWTPFATLIHHESATRGQDQTPEKQARAEREWRRMQACWGDQMHHDPAYNDNLSCGYEDFSLAWPPRGWPWRKDKPTA
jgi:O-antigen biosynthesis protein